MIRLGLAEITCFSDNHLAILSGQEGVSITGVYLPEYLNSSQPLCGNLPVFNDPCQLIAGSDALVFTGDPSGSFELMVAALRDSRHILIPNPVFLSRKKVDYLFKLAEEAGVALIFSQPLHYHPVIRGMQAFLSKPEYIEIKRRINLSGEKSDIKGSMIRSLSECIDASLFTNNTNLKKHKILHLPVAADDPEIIHTRLELDNACIINIQLDRFPGEEIFESTFYQNGIEVRADLLNHQVHIIRTDQPGKELYSYNPGNSADAMVAEILQFIDIIRTDCPIHRQGATGLISFLISNSVWHQLAYSLTA